MGREREEEREGKVREGGRERRKMFIGLEFSLAFKIDVKLQLFIKHTS